MSRSESKHCDKQDNEDAGGWSADISLWVRLIAGFHGQALHHEIMRLYTNYARTRTIDVRNQKHRSRNDNWQD